MLTNYDEELRKSIHENPGERSADCRSYFTHAIGPAAPGGRPGGGSVTELVCR